MNVIWISISDHLSHVGFQVSRLSLSHYFRSCESLGLVPKVPKCIMHDTHNDEEGMLSTILDLEQFNLCDVDLQSW
jgi:hypothetical protein